MNELDTKYDGVTLRDLLLDEDHYGGYFTEVQRDAVAAWKLRLEQ